MHTMEMSLACGAMTRLPEENMRRWVGTSRCLRAMEVNSTDKPTSALRPEGVMRCGQTEL
jgi:hypothetical protein